MCDNPPIRGDWVGIYPCNATTFVASLEWWNSLCTTQAVTCNKPMSDFGYVEGQVYVRQFYTWFSRVCGPPEDGGCQTNQDLVWPSQGSFVIDPSVAGTDWAFPGGRTLSDGCYKIVLAREQDSISPPPYPTICAPWEEAFEFWVGPNPNSPLPTDAPIVGGGGAAGSSAACSANPGCANLQGDCCPTSNNVFLDCCANTDALAVLSLESNGDQSSFSQNGASDSRGVSFTSLVLVWLGVALITSRG